MAGKRSNGEGSILYDKRRKNYRARITVGWEFDEETGKTKQIIKNLGSFKTKGAAASALSEYLNNPYDIDKKNITFSEFYPIWLDEFLKDHDSFKYKMKSAYKYCSAIYNKKLRDITITDMKKCIYEGTVISDRGKDKGQPKSASPQTKKDIKSMFNRLFTYALECRIVDRNLAKEFSLNKDVFEQEVKNKKVKKPFTNEELDKMWRSIEFIPFVDVFLFACYSGWRPGEIIKLKIENVHIDENYITGGLKNKAAKNRIVPIHPLVKNIVIKYYNDAIENNSEYLFNDSSVKRGIGLSKDQYLSRFNKMIFALKFDIDHTPHDTRHTFVTKAKRAGIDEYILKQVVGHRITDVTEDVYTHRGIDELINEINKIPK